MPRPETVTSMPIKPSRLLVLAAALCGLAEPSLAQAANEQLIALIPPDFKFAGQLPRDDVKMQVFVPANETIQNWSEQIVTQVRPNPQSVDAVEVLHSIEKLWIATVQRFAIGGACQLLHVIDHVIATRGSRLYLPARKEGIIPGASNLRLPRFVGDRAARQAILSGREWTAGEPDAGCRCRRIRSRR